jgi:phosphatidylglycerophosphate synthase
LLLAAALFIQLRLLCNLFDGMVAVEGGKAQKDGAFWNEAPDRVSDILILAGAGYGLALAGVGPELGWAAAALAVLTAYVRELGRSLGAPADYGGPMAKQQRMMVVTLGAVLAAAEPAWGWSGESMTAALALVAAGSLVTVLLRSSRFIGFLRKGRD